MTRPAVPKVRIDPTSKKENLLFVNKKKQKNFIN